MAIATDIESRGTRDLGRAADNEMVRKHQPDRLLERAVPSGVNMKAVLGVRLIGAILGGLVAMAVTPAEAQKAAEGQSTSTASGEKRADAINDAVLASIMEITDRHWHKGEYNHIINLERMVIAGRPDHLDAYANAAWLLWSMNRDAEAVALYEQGLKANPKTAFMYDELGHYYYNRKKDYTTAIRYYEKAVTFGDCPDFTYRMLAHSYERNKQLDKALVAWQRAVEKFPESQPAKNNLDRVRRLIEQRGAKG
jgi:tetratricopeptide (TPR) repeat protein